MKVLNVNKFYYMRGGSEAYYFALMNLLEENKIEVIPFSMKDKRNFNSKYENYFVENIDYSNMNFKKKVINSAKIIYSLEAYKKIDALISDTKPDIAHLHIFQHQLSTSIIHALKKYSIPIVNTIHDLKIICPNYKMLNSNGICEACKGKNYKMCFKNSCVKGSKTNSLVSTIEAYSDKLLKSYEYVDKFICPSRFYRDKFIEFGIPEDKVIYLPNFIDLEKYNPNYKAEDYFIYIGRLSEEKGIKTLIESMCNVKNSRLYIVGTGPMEAEFKQYANDLNLNNIKFLGFKTGKELQDIVQNSKFVVVPSEWYENCPMTVIESMAYGKAVIGSNIGGIPELIDDGRSGLIFNTFDKDDLSDKINYLLENESEAVTMGVNARHTAEKLYDKNTHFERLKEIYKKVSDK